MSDWKIIQPFEESHWSAYYRLRYEILRKPWGQGSPDHREPDEKNALHGMILDNHEQALATARIHQIDNTTAQIRFMAVRNDMQGKGLGKAMLHFIESIGRKKIPGLQKIILQSRENAVPFYQHNGYQLVEKSFLLFDNIQHFLMEKKLIKPV
jgi:predicted GNAT family N-acyltransferase